MTWHPLNRARANAKTLSLIAADDSALDGLLEACGELEAKKCPECRLVDGFHKEGCKTGEWELIDQWSEEAIAKGNAILREMRRASS